MSARASARLTSIFESMVAAIVEPDAMERHEKNGAAWFEGRGLEPRDAESLAGVEPKAWFVYRHLVRRALRGAIENELPRTKEILGKRFFEDVDAYLSRSLPASHYLRDVAFEFVAFAAPRWGADASLPAFVEELARFELVAFESASALPPPGTPPRAAIEPKIDLGAPVIFDESVRLVRFSHPVHELEPGATELEPRPTSLIVYRDREHDLKTLELSELMGDMVEALLANETLRVAIVRACERRAAAMTPELLGDIARILADYAERGMLLGVEQASTSSAPKRE